MKCTTAVLPRFMRKVHFTLLLACLACTSVGALGADSESASSSTPTGHVVVKNQGFLPFADAPINYRSSELNDPVAKLEKRLEHGDIKLHYDSQHGYLKSVLDALHIAATSQ